MTDPDLVDPWIGGPGTKGYPHAAAPLRRSSIAAQEIGTGVDAPQFDLVLRFDRLRVELASIDTRGTVSRTELDWNRATPVQLPDDWATSRPGERGSPKEINEFVRFGAGPRGSQALVLAAKARAALRGEAAADLDDIREMLIPALRHRLVLGYRAEAEGVSELDILETVRKATRLPPPACAPRLCSALLCSPDGS